MAVAGVPDESSALAVALSVVSEALRNSPRQLPPEQVVGILIRLRQPQMARSSRHVRAFLVKRGQHKYADHTHHPAVGGPMTVGMLTEVISARIPIDRHVGSMPLESAAAQIRCIRTPGLLWPVAQCSRSCRDIPLSKRPPHRGLLHASRERFVVNCLGRSVLAY